RLGGPLPAGRATGVRAAAVRGVLLRGAVSVAVRGVVGSRAVRVPRTARIGAAAERVALVTATAVHAARLPSVRAPAVRLRTARVRIALGGTAPVRPPRPGVARARVARLRAAVRPAEGEHLGRLRRVRRGGRRGGALPADLRVDGLLERVERVRLPRGRAEAAGAERVRRGGRCGRTAGGGGGGRRAARGGGGGRALGLGGAGLPVLDHLADDGNEGQDHDDEDTRQDVPVDVLDRAA